MRLLQTIEVEFGILAHKGLDDLSSQELAVVSGMVAKQELRLSTFFQYDEYSAVYHEVDITAKDIDDLNGTVDHHTFGYIDIKTILCQHGIQGCHGIIIVLCQSVVIRCRCKLFQGTNDNTLWQMTFRSVLLIEPVVDHKVETCREIRHITAEGLIGVDRYCEAIEVQAIIGFEELGDVRVFIAFHLTSREATRRKALKGSITLTIHHLRRMVADHLATLLVQLNILLF